MNTERGRDGMPEFESSRERKPEKKKTEQDSKDEVQEKGMQNIEKGSVSVSLFSLISYLLSLLFKHTTIITINGDTATIESKPQRIRADGCHVLPANFFQI
jgi:hypothetical protein